jgi:hypothetical protein
MDSFFDPIESFDYETTYYWQIYAYDEYGTKVIGTQWIFTTAEYVSGDPYTPSNPNPSDGETGVSINIDFSWTGGDPDGDPVAYNVYLSTNETSINLVAENITDTSYDPGTLEYITTYYWYITARDDHNNTATGEIWSFTTRMSINKPPEVVIVKPEKAFYIDNQKILPRLIRLALIIGDITIEVNVTDEDSVIEKVEFYIDGKLVKTTNSTNDDGLYFYIWTRDRLRFIHLHYIKIIAYDDENTGSDRIFVRRFL